MNDAEAIYEVIEDDPLSWLEQAEGARLSAEVIRTALTTIMPLSQTIPGVREKKLAYMNSFMLLTGISFENLLKGLAVAKKPKSWRELRADGGHGLSFYAEKVTTVSAVEARLLERLQEYLLWAGRYAIPTTAQRYANRRGLRCLRTDDREVASSLFARLKQELYANAPQSV